MNLTFWIQVAKNWQSLQADATNSKVNMELFRSVFMDDIATVKEVSSSMETPLELLNDDDFWGDF